MARTVITTLLIVGCAGVVAGLYVVRATERRPPTAAAQSIRPQRRMISNTVNATGTVRLRVGSEVRVGSQLSGIVNKLNVTVGSTVKAGDVIAEIDGAPLRARLAQADAQVELDHATMERVRIDAERADQLGAQGLIPVQQQQDLQLALGEAKAKYEKSLRDRDLVKVDLGYVQIRAPISGTIASVSTQEGETVAAAFTAPTFVTIIGEHALQLIAMVDETDIAHVRRGNPVAFTVDAYPSRDFFGTVESVAPKATIVSGVVNYEVTIDISKNATLLKPDMTANISIATARHDALVVPSQAVQHDGDQAFVYVRSPSGPLRKPVIPGAKDGAMTEIKKGIAAGEEILLKPAA